MKWSQGSPAPILPGSAPYPNQLASRNFSDIPGYAAPVRYHATSLPPGSKPWGNPGGLLFAMAGLRLGIIVVFSTGCVSYTRRFFEEMLDDPVFGQPDPFS